jgi:NAD-dependent DNA ligase
MDNYDNLDFRRFTSRSEADKAINSLKGILMGMNFDLIINDLEIQELDNWCTKHSNLVNRNPFKEFMSLIKESIKDSSMRKDTLEDLYWLCQKYEQDSIYYNAVTCDLQTLQGICHGIISDGIIKDVEIFELDKWLDQHEHLITYYPYDEIKCLVISVLSDGKIDDEERKRLLAYFNEFSNIVTKEVAQKVENEIINIPISGICTIDPRVEFDGKTFCFTGVAKRAPRSELIQIVNDCGGIYADNVIKNTDYLIVGDNGNPCWAFACYGRKVEKAINLRKQGHKISIIHEFDFWDFADEYK